MSASRAAPRGPRGPQRDVRRVREIAVAALASMICALAAWLLVPGDHQAIERSPGPLARPHVVAGLACDSCHARQDGATAEASCAGCHRGHASTRAAHRALAANGKLGCTTCHAAHAASPGITFAEDGAYVRFGPDGESAGRTSVPGLSGVTVPLVPREACARCHDLSRATDPALACFAAGVDASLCFDEHPASATRFVAWDAARAAVRGAPAPRPVPPSRASFAFVGIAVAAASLAFVGGAALRERRARLSARPPSAGLAVPVRVRLPQIDTSTCLGCYACVDACPFDVLAVDKYVAVVERPKDCCGAGTCESACPNGSLRIAEGAPLEERPRVDDTLESPDAPGVYVAGDLTGLPLIKNAIAQGARAMDAAARSLRGSGAAGVADVVIVGAGPAGLSAALRAKELGLSYVLLEQGTMAASIKSFPRDKLVFDPPLDMPAVGPLWISECTKEELLAQWTRITRRHGIVVREGHRVAAITRTREAGHDGAFLVTAKTDRGDAVVRGRRLLLCIGRRGTPRPLGAEIAKEAEAKVSYALADARSFAGKRVLVVGLGDAAMEAACAIARQPGTDVTVSYRGKGFERGKARNIAELQAFVAAGRVRLVFESTVSKVGRDSVTLATLATPGGEETFGNDGVVVLIGGVPAWDVVEAAGVRRTRREGGEGGEEKDRSPPRSV